MAPTDLCTLVVSARMAGTACSAGVLPGSPATRPVENCTVFPSALRKLPVARYSWYACAGIRPPRIGPTCVGGSSFAGPSAPHRPAYSDGVNVMPPTGLRGPLTCENSELERSSDVMVASGAGLAHTD